MIQPDQDKERIRRNVLKMRAAGAPEADVLAYLQHEDSQVPQVGPGAMTSDATSQLDKNRGVRPEKPPEAFPGADILGMIRTALPLGGVASGIAGVMTDPLHPVKGWKSGRDEYTQTAQELRARHPVAGAAAPLIGGALLAPLMAPEIAAEGAASTVLGRTLANPVTGGATMGAAYADPGRELISSLLGAGIGKATTALPWVKRNVLGRPDTQAAGEKAILGEITRSGQTPEDVINRGAVQTDATGTQATLQEAMGPAAPQAIAQVSKRGLPDETAFRASQLAAAAEPGISAPNIVHPNVKHLYELANKAKPIELVDAAGKTAFRKLQRVVPGSFTAAKRKLSNMYQFAVDHGDPEAQELLNDVARVTSFQLRSTMKKQRMPESAMEELSKSLPLRFLDLFKKEIDDAIKFHPEGTPAAMRAADATTKIRASRAELTQWRKDLIDAIDNRVLAQEKSPIYMNARNAAGSKIQAQKLLRQYKKDLVEAYRSAAGRPVQEVKPLAPEKAVSNTLFGRPAAAASNLLSSLPGGRAAQKEADIIFQRMAGTEIAPYLHSLMAKKVARGYVTAKRANVLGGGAGSLLSRIFPLKKHEDDATQ